MRARAGSLARVLFGKKVKVTEQPIDASTAAGKCFLDSSGRSPSSRPTLSGLLERRIGVALAAATVPKLVVRDSEPLDRFVKRKGGINACAGRFSRRPGRGAAKRSDG